MDRNPEGYYLNEDDGFYEKCYETCKYCYGPGNIKDNNCKEYKSNFIFLSNSFNIINDLIIEKMKKYLLKNYNETKNGNDLEIDKNPYLITLTNTYNQNNTLSENKTYINLGERKDKLIKYYNISENASLYIFKIDFKEEGMKIPKVEYEVFYPLNGSDLSILDLSVCGNSRINISIPININGSEIKTYNPNSDYYNDICSTTTSKSGTDITLSDRRNHFIDNNMTLCEEDCNLEQYNSSTKRVVCSCKIKDRLSNIKDLKFDKKNYIIALLILKILPILL